MTQNTVMAWNRRSRSSERRLRRCACISSWIFMLSRCCSRCAAPNARTRPMLLTMSVRSPLTCAAWPAKLWCSSRPCEASHAMMAPSTVTTTSSTAVKCQLIVPSTKMLAITAAPGGIVVQVERVLDRPRGIGRRRDAPGERAGKLFDEVARALTGQMVEQLQSHVAAHGDEGVRRRPAGDAPQQVVAGNEPQQDSDRAPEKRRRRLMGASTSTRCFTAYCEPTLQQHRRQHRHQHDEVTEKSSPHIASQKADRTFGRVAWQGHGVDLPVIGSPLFLVKSQGCPAGERCQSVSVFADSLW